MNNLLKTLFKRKHRCNFKKPIVSMYWTFGSRKVVFECECGKREIQNVFKGFSEPFPIQTSMIDSTKELEKALSNDWPSSPIEKLLCGVGENIT